MRTKRRIKIGKTYGYWTAISCVRSNRWLCRCRCGVEEIKVACFLQIATRGCPNCRAKHVLEIGQVINGSKILERVDKQHYLCTCSSCNKQIVRNSASLINSATGKCASCAHSKLDDRNTHIINRLTTGARLEELAKEYGITKERVRQLFERYASDEQKELRYGYRNVIRRLAERLKVSTGKIALLIKKAGLRPSVNDIDIIQHILEKTKEERNKCTVCGNQRTSESRRAFKLSVCSEECRMIKVRSQRQKLLVENKPPKLSLPALAYEVIQSVPAGNRWVSHAEAQKISQLTRMQISWLRRRKVIATKDSGDLHPVLKTPIQLYSLDQIKAIGLAWRKKVYGV